MNTKEEKRYELYDLRIEMIEIRTAVSMAHYEMGLIM